MKKIIKTGGEMSWKKVKLGEVLTESKIPSEKPDVNRRITVRLNVQGVQKRGIENEIAGATKQYIRKAGQFIYGKQNFHKGAFGIIPKELDGFETSADLPAFDVDKKQTSAEWIFYFFKQGNFYLELSKIARGVATQRIHPEQIFDIEIPLPDLKTQNQFLENAHKIESDIDTLSTELSHQLDLVKKLRQQLLQDAVQGKLVEQNKKDEPASELLKKIKAEKLNSVGLKPNAKKKTNSLALKGETNIQPEEIPFQIPDNWVWCRLGEICTKIGSGSTPKGSNYSTNGKPFFRSQNIYDSGLVYDDIKFISDEVHKQMNGTKVYANDILLNITGGSMGRCALVPANFGEGNVSQHVCIIRPLLVDSNFFHSITLSPFFQRFIFSSTTGAGREGLPKYNLEQFIIPIPPLSEQNRIVQKLDELMAYCNKLEASIKQSQAQNETLLQQVLREALRPPAGKAGKEMVEA